MNTRAKPRLLETDVDTDLRELASEASHDAAARSAHPAPFPGGQRWMTLAGKLRALVASRLARGIPINRRNVALFIAAELADMGELSTPDLRRWCGWAGLANISARLAQDIVEEAFHCRAMARSRGYCRSLTRKAAGKLLDLVAVERDEHAFWWPIAIDETPAQGRARRAAERAARKATTGPTPDELAKAAERRRKDAKRKRAKRRAEGRPTQVERSGKAAKRRAEIEAAGIHRTTLWRRNRSPDATVASAATVASVGGLSGGRSIDPTTNADAAPDPSLLIARKAGPARTGGSNLGTGADVPSAQGLPGKNVMALVSLVKGWRRLSGLSLRARDLTEEDLVVIRDEARRAGAIA